MANINAGDLLRSMVNAGASAFNENWPTVEAFAVNEFRKIAMQIADIENGVLTHQYSPEVGDALFRMQKIASTNVLLAMSGMTMLAVEAAINAVLNVIKDTVNTAIGFVLIA